MPDTKLPEGWTLLSEEADAADLGTILAFYQRAEALDLHNFTNGARAGPVTLTTAQLGRVPMVAEVIECLKDLCDLLDGLACGQFSPASFSSQPARRALAPWEATNAT